MENRLIKFYVFAGREKNIKILHKYLEEIIKNNIINEYHIFDFSRNFSDHNFLKNEYIRLNYLYKKKVFLDNYDENEILLKNNNKNIDKKTNWNPFYKYIYNNSKDDDIIIKCDDDILFIDINNLIGAIEDRKKDKISFLIHSNCINNGICAYFQQNIFSEKIRKVLKKYPIGGLLGPLFENPEIAYGIHNQFSLDLIKNIENLNKYFINDQYINSRISINFILINGEDCKYFENIMYDDEYMLSSYIPEKLLRYNKIKGDFITSHYSYSLQEIFLLKCGNIYDNYNKICSIYLEKYKIIQKSIGIISSFVISDSSILTCMQALPQSAENNNLILESSIFNKLNTEKSSINSVYTVKNWITNTSFYIKNINTNKYLYIDYDEDVLKLGYDDTQKTIFNIEMNKDGKLLIRLGIYFLTQYSCKGKFRNENIFFKYFKNESEKWILLEDLNENRCNDINKIINNNYYIKFYKYNSYLAIDSNMLLQSSNKLKDLWKFEKIYSNNIDADTNTDKYIDVTRFDKNNKFYYKNIKNNDIYTNYYLGWGLESILYKKID